ncbi:hypothetical protein [Streptococcus ferus]|uniref:hypothetical protein n=1 Tax=Streptococcus ferus TaxID=1345 RepID=UPI0035A0DF32
MKKQTANANKVMIPLVVLCLLVILVGCRIREVTPLTVTNIHDSIVRYQTTTNDLRQMYGEPYKISKGEDEAEEIQQKILDNEYSTDDHLDDQNYWDTVKKSSDSKRPTGNYQVCYEYQGEKLGVKAVYFFVIDDKVVSFMFDNQILDKKVAKKDKYLHQFID